MWRSSPTISAGHCGSAMLCGSSYPAAMSFEIAASGTFVTLLISCQNQLTQSQIHPSIQHIHLNTVPNNSGSLVIITYSACQRMKAPVAVNVSTLIMRYSTTHWLFQGCILLQWRGTLQPAVGSWGHMNSVLTLSMILSSWRRTLSLSRETLTPAGNWSSRHTHCESINEFQRWHQGKASVQRKNGLMMCIVRGWECKAKSQADMIKISGYKNQWLATPAANNLSWSCIAIPSKALTHTLVAMRCQGFETNWFKKTIQPIYRREFEIEMDIS